MPDLPIGLSIRPLRIAVSPVYTVLTGQGRGHEAVIDFERTNQAFAGLNCVAGTYFGLCRHGDYYITL